jgi:hypothetical protein
MSLGIDVNILLYASDASSPLHEKAAEFLCRRANGREIFCLAWETVISYVRMATHPAIFDRPLSHDEAARNVQALLTMLSCRVIAEEDGSGRSIAW